MAQFKFSSPNEIEAERAKTIEELIPGSLEYYHLFFLDLVKKKKTQANWTPEQVKLWEEFQTQHGDTTEFYEVETWLTVINPIEALPTLDENSSPE